MTLHSKHLSALSSDIANHRDVKLILHDTTIQASLLEWSEHRSRYKLVGLMHDLEYWNGHGACPVLGDEWEREYEPSELFDSEKWIRPIFEPARKAFFVKNNFTDPETMQFMMSEKPTRSDAEVVVLLGLHQELGGSFKLVYILRRLRCLHVYEIVSQGREWWFTMHLTTNVRYGLAELHPSFEKRKHQFPTWWINGAGVGYPPNDPPKVGKELSNDLGKQAINGEKLVLNKTTSVLIIRDPEHHLNRSGGREIFVPSRLLQGALPDALLDAYHFWQDESAAPQNVNQEQIRQAELGYKKLRGYPVKDDDDYMLIVEMKFNGSWLDFNRPRLAASTRPRSCSAQYCPGGRSLSPVDPRS